MAIPSEVSRMLDVGVATHVLPIAGELGMAAVTNPHKPRPGLVARTLIRPLSGGRALIWQIWCDGKTRLDLTWRLDVLEGELWRDLSLTFPFHRAGFPPARPSGGSHFELQEFHPHRSVERFDRAMRFMGALLVAYADQIVTQVEELRSVVAAAGTSPEWLRARGEGAALWGARLVEGEVDPTERPATVVFVGANMVVLDAAGERVSFKFPVEGIEKGAPARVAGWWTTLAATRSATILTVGSRTWRFDFDGRLVPSP